MPVDTDFLRQLFAGNEQAEQGQQAAQAQQGAQQLAQAQFANPRSGQVQTSGVAPPSQLPPPGQPGDLLVVGANGRAAWMSPRAALQLRVELPPGTVLSRETIEQGFVITAATARDPGGELLPTNADVIRGLYGSGPPVKLVPPA